MPRIEGQILLLGRLDWNICGPEPERCFANSFRIVGWPGILSGSKPPGSIGRTVGPLSGQGRNPPIPAIAAEPSFFPASFARLPKELPCGRLARRASIRGCRVPLDERAMGEGLVCAPAGVVVSVNLI